MIATPAFLSWKIKISLRALQPVCSPFLEVQDENQRKERWKWIQKRKEKGEIETFFFAASSRAMWVPDAQLLLQERRGGVFK